MSNLFVQLGRYGDVMNILPLLYDDAQKGERSSIMVSKEFAGIMDGVGYADCVVFDGHMSELPRAVSMAEQLSQNVKCVQLVGPLEAVKNVVTTRNGSEYRTTKDSFLKDQWELAGRMSDWKRQLPLIFDRRNPDREAELLKKYLPNRRKVILFSAGGTSSPFEYKELLYELLVLKFGKRYNIVDIGKITCERIYDLLGLYESGQVRCLVATDSSPLHLAYAAKSLPVVAFVNDKPSLWHGSVWRPNHIFHCRYHEFTKRQSIDRLMESIESISGPGSPFIDCGSPRVIHVWSEYSDHRHGLASEVRGPWVECPIDRMAIGRDSHTALKDEQRHPFVKDVIRLASLRAADDDVICLTRSDTVFVATGKEVLDCAPCYAHRTIGAPPIQRHHPTCDLFAFSKKWWREHQSEYPDMVMGRDVYWPRVLMELIRKHGGKELPDSIYTNKPQPPPNSAPSNSPPRVAHNQHLFTEFMSKNDVRCLIPPVAEQVKLEPLQTGMLFDHGYNPSIIKTQNGFIMAYRWHGSDSLNTWLAIAELNPDLSIRSNFRVTIAGVSDDVSCDDPRLFVRDGNLYCSFVVSTWPSDPPTCVVRYGELTRQKSGWVIDKSIQPVYAKNDFTALEKNWIFFERDPKLFCIYHNKPEQVVLEIDGDRVVDEHRSPTPNWKWGDIHGGTNPIWHKGKLLRFFHTRMDNEPPPVRWRYYIGAALMESVPPFNIVSVSSRPIVVGSESDDLGDMERASVIQYKRNVVFPGGCARDGDNYLLSFGINDSRCAILRLADKDLRL